MRGAILLAVAGLISLPTLASAQSAGTYKARLEPDAKNIGACERLDTSLRREHTLTVAGAEANLVSAGGVKAKMKAMGANVFQNDRIQMGAEQFLIVADLSRTPGAVVVTENRMGCRWSGELKQ